MEFGVRKIFLSHLNGISTIGQKNRTLMLIQGKRTKLFPTKIFQLFGIAQFYPARFVNVDGLPFTLRSVFVFQTVLNHLKLKWANGTDDFPIGHLVHKQLGHSFVHQLINSFGQLFLLERIGILDVAEIFGRKRGNAHDVHFLALGEGIPNSEVSGVVQTHNIAGISLIHGRFFGSHEGGYRREFHHALLAHVEVILVAVERARNNFHESNSIAVFRVDVRVDFKNESGKFIFGWFDHP